MDSSASASRDPRLGTAQFSKAGWLGAWLAFALYGVLIGTHVGAWAGGADSSGYLNNARLLRAGHFKETPRAISGLPANTMPGYSYVPLGFIPAGANQMTPTYPVGLPMLMVAVSPFCGWPLAPHVTMWLHAMFGVALMFGLARTLGFSIPAALLAALLLAVCPLYIFMSIQAMSDTPALVWCTAAVFFAWLSRKKALWALAAGLSVAVAVLVRPSNLLIVAPVALCLGFSWRRWWWLGLGGAPGAAFLAHINLQLYGQVFTTGYGNVSAIFAGAYLLPALKNYAQWLPVVLTPLVVLVLGLPFVVRRESRLVVSVLGVWMLGFAGFYGFYFHTHETWWYLRFILPAFPAMIVAMLLVGRRFAAGWTPRTARLLGSAGVAALLGWSAFWSNKLSALDSGRGEKTYPLAARWARANLPPNSVVMVMQMSGAMLYYTDLTFLRYDQFTPHNFSPIERFCQAEGRPIYAVLFPFERVEVLQTRLPGQWVQVGAVEDVTIWRRDQAEGTTPKIVPWSVLLDARIDGKEIIAKTGAGWFGRERDSRHVWAWSGGQGVIELESPSRENRSLVLEFGVRSLAPSQVVVTQGGIVLWQGKVGTKISREALTLQIKEGRGQLDFHTDVPATPESAEPDARRLAFALYDLRLKKTVGGP